MKTVFYLPALLLLLCSCKSGSFLHRRYTDLHVSHTHKKIAEPALLRTKRDKAQTTVPEVQSAAAIQAVPFDTSLNKQATIPDDQRVKNGKQAAPHSKVLKAAEVKGKALKSYAAGGNKQLKGAHKNNKDKKDKEREKNKGEGAGMAVFILVLGALSGLILSFVAYYLLLDALGAALLLLLAVPFVVGTLILLMAYHTAGYRKWIVLTYIGACLLIIPAVLVFFFTYMFH